MTTEELRIKISADTSELKKSINQAKKEISGLAEGAEGTAGATAATTASMEELKDAMEQIRGMQAFDIITKSISALKGKFPDVTKNIKGMKDSLEMFAEELRGTFDFKNWDIDPNEGLKGYFDTMKTAGGEAIRSLKSGFASLGAAAKEVGVIIKTALSTTIAKAAALLTVLVSIVGLVKNGLSVSAQGKSINVLAQQAGMSADAYQRWAFVLEQVGLQVDDMIGAQQTLLEAQVDVREGAEDMIASFKRIGLSQKEVLSMNQQQLFEKTIEGLQNVENSTERATLAFKLLSEDSKNLAPLLNLSSQEVAMLASNFNTLNGAMSAGLIQTSNRLQASLGNLRAAWQGLRNTLAELVLPVIIAVVNWLTKAIAIVNLFLRTVFGLEIGGASSTGGIESAAGAVGGYADSVENATEAVQKLKRVTMGFDELNIVGNPNSGGSSGAGADAGAGGLGGGYAGGVTDSLFNADALDMSKWQEFFTKYKNLIQDITTWGLIGVGVGVAVLGALSGNIPMVLAGLGLAGIGFAVGNAEDGTFDRLRKKFEEMNLQIVPAAMVGIGAAGAVISLLMGNIPAAIAFAAMAGIGLSLGGGSTIKKFVDDYGKEIIGVVSSSMIAAGAVCGALGLMTGNIPLALAGLGMAGIGLGIGALTSGGLDKFLTTYEKDIARAVNVSVLGIGAVGAVACLLMGNIPGAIAMGAMAGIAVYNLATGGNFFEDIFSAIKDIWGKVKNWFNTTVKPVFTKEWWSNLFSSVKNSVKEFFAPAAEWFNGGWTAVKNWFNTNIKPVFTKEWWGNVFNSIKEAVSTKLGEARTAIINGWNNIKAYWTENIAPKFTLDYWKNKFDTIRAAIQEKLGAARTQVMNSWNSIKSYFSEHIAPKFTKQYWANKLDTIRAAASEKLDAARTTIINSWNNIKKYFNDNIAPKFTKTYWQNKFNTIKDGAKAAFNGVIAVVESAVNGIIRKINTLSWKIPDWVPKYGGDKFGFNLKTISIPRLAEGGIAVSSTLANIGENGDEAVLPLENNTSWMDTLADKIASRNQTPSKIVLMVDGKQLGWAAINNINGITKQTGGLQLQLV